MFFLHSFLLTAVFLFNLTLFLRIYQLRNEEQRNEEDTDLAFALLLIILCYVHETLSYHSTSQVGLDLGTSKFNAIDVNSFTDKKTRLCFSPCV